MIDFVCPRCGTHYHSEESHIGKQIRCTNPECQSLVPIVPLAGFVEPKHSKGKWSVGRALMAKRRQIYAVAISLIAVVPFCFLLLRHFNGSERKSGTLWPGTPTPDLAVTPTPIPTPERIPEDETQATTIAPPPGFLPDRPRSGQQQTADSRPKEYYSLPSGTRIEPDIATGGHGKFTAKNGTDDDAVVRLSDVATDQTIRWFFVQAGSSADVGQIPQGSYRVSFTTGLNWIESEDRFSWHPDYREYDRIFEYSVRRDSEGAPYKATAITVTLHSVPFGNVRTKRITREEFLKGHHHVDLQR